MAHLLLMASVITWVPHIEEARERQDVRAARYPTAFFLALLEVESFPKGCATSHRAGSQYEGAFQMSPAYALDAGFTRLEDALVDPTTQVEAVIRYMEKYRSLHLYQLSEMARLHKVGPAAFARGETHDEYMERWTQAFQSAVRWEMSEGPSTRTGGQYEPVPCT